MQRSSSCMIRENFPKSDLPFRSHFQIKIKCTLKFVLFQASTTPADAISPSGESPTNEVTTSNGVPLSQVFGQSRQNSIQFGQSRHNSIQSLGHAGRATKPRMRAAVQGLEEEDSDDGEIEVVDFNDGTYDVIKSSSLFSVLTDAALNSNALESFYAKIFFQFALLLLLRRV